MIIIAIIIYFISEFFLLKQLIITLSLTINSFLKHVLLIDIIIYNNNKNEIIQIVIIIIKFSKI